MVNYLPPFLVKTHEYSIYGKVQLVGHREYNTVEVMGLEDEEGRMLIHVIISLHDGSGLRFINDRQVVTNIKMETPARKAFYSPIELEHIYTDETRRIYLRLYTEKNEEIVLRFKGGKAAYYPQSLMCRPAGYINHHELPIGFSFKLRKILQPSTVEVNRRNYRLAPINEFLGFRYGAVGRMAESFIRLNFMIPWERMHCTHSPETLQAGESWQYTVGARRIQYLIKSADRDMMVVGCGEEEHILQLIDGKMMLSKICSITKSRQQVDVNFIPPVPLEKVEESKEIRVVVVSDSVAVYEAMMMMIPQREGNLITLIGDRKYHSEEDDLAYLTSQEGPWVINNIHEHILVEQ